MPLVDVAAISTVYQTITWANVDQDHYHHMPLVDLTEWIV